ncbi:TonB-dependent receptor domain-containing protein [Pedobacter boryungensis]|uniref:TonB-dependent receptor n=1 Tax=Pedobacter boryungensis TaxID=869962 RepID=A0ABX2DEQ7_9SPHI|nr:TonB-dependent receptor [Pedobacter boryungensis]NQX32470.1 TonB-dependent receptor [Pedobacter boryungensis]
MHSFRILLFVFIFLITNITLFAQALSFKIKGKILTENKQTINGATVSLINLDNKEIAKTVSTVNGIFELSFNLKGTYTLIIKHIGFETYKSIFELDNKDLGEIYLTSNSQTLNEVVVQKKQNLIEVDANSITYNVAKSITAQGGNALDALKNAPGIFIDNNNSIALNGKQGAMILLDGKQTYLSSKEIVDLLRSMPASEIKSIEIINSPTAKYDAAGSSGIINIKRLKSQNVGFNGTTTTGLSYGVYLRQNQDLSFNYRNDKLNIYGSYNHFLGYYSYLYGSDRIQNGKTYNSFTDDIDKRKKMGTRLGIDYNLNDKNTVGILVNGNFIFGGGITDTKTDIGLPNSSTIDQTLSAINDYYHQNTQRYNVNLNYKYEDSLGKIINIDADYGYYEKSAGNLQSNIYTTQNTLTQENYYRTLNGAKIYLKAIKADYTTNLWKGKLETGAKYSAIETTNNSRFFQVFNQNEVFDERISNTFTFDENITSAYVNYKKPFGKWVLQGGLRVENSDSEGELAFKMNGKDSLENIKRNYTNLFPSFSASVKASENHNFSFGYSRRIDRPAYNDLNPFVYLLDELSFWQGNPFLKPQLSHRFTLQYAYKSNTIVSLNFAHTSDFSASITDTVAKTSIVMIPRNLGIQRNISLSITQIYNPTKWWDITFNGSVYHIQNKIAFDQYRNLNLKQFAGRLNIQQRFKMPYEITGEVLGFLTSRRLIGGNQIMKPTSQIDLGLQRNFLKNSATLRLAFTDIYKGSKGYSTQNFEGFYMKNYSYFETRQIKLNFTYKFADSKAKGPRSRNSALENENGRIK